MFGEGFVVIKLWQCILLVIDGLISVFRLRCWCYQPLAINVSRLWLSDINVLVGLLLLSTLGINVSFLWSRINALAEVLFLSNLGIKCSLWQSDIAALVAMLLLSNLGITCY